MYDENGELIELEEGYFIEVSESKIGTATVRYLKPVGGMEGWNQPLYFDNQTRQSELTTGLLINELQSKRRVAAIHAEAAGFVVLDAPYKASLLNTQAFVLKKPADT